MFFSMSLSNAVPLNNKKYVIVGISHILQNFFIEEQGKVTRSILEIKVHYIFQRAGKSDTLHIRGKSA